MIFDILLIIWAIGACYFIWSLYKALDDPKSDVSLDLLPMWLWKGWSIYLSILWPVWIVPAVYYMSKENS